MIKKTWAVASFVLMLAACIPLYPVCSSAGDKVDFCLHKVRGGELFSLKGHTSKCTVIVFGSLYCKPCIELIPVLNRLHEDYKDDGLLAVGIDIDMSTDEERLKSFADEKKITFLFLRDSCMVAKKYKVFILPTTLIVDANGKIVKRYTGFQSYGTLEKHVRKMCGK